MSETLFLPMGLWAVYLTNETFTKTENIIELNDRNGAYTKYLFRSFLLGFYYYLVYMCKEVGAVFLASFAVFWLAYLLYGLKTRKFDKRCRKILLLQLASVCLGFFIVMYIIKLAVFSGNGSTYNVMDTSVYSNLFNIYYVNYGVIYFISMTIFAYGVFPVIYPLLNWKQLGKKDLNFLAYIILLLVISAIVVAYKVLAGENQGQITPRIHLRFICYLFIPYVVMMLNVYEHNANIELKKMIISIIALSAWYFLIAFTGFQAIVPQEDFVDQTMLQYMSQNMNYQMVILCIYFLAVFSIAILLCKKKKVGIILILGSLIVVNVWNGVLTIGYRKYINSCDTEQDLDEIEWLSTFISGCPEQNILILSDGGKKSSFLATYADEKNVFTLDYDSYYAYFENAIPDQVSWNDVQENVHIPRFNSKYSTLTEVNYIILVDSINTTLDDSNGILVDSPLSDAKVYSLIDSSKVPNLTFHTKVLHAN